MNITFQKITGSHMRYYFYIDGVKGGKVIWECNTWVAYGFNDKARSKKDKETAVQNLMKERSLQTCITGQ